MNANNFGVSPSDFRLESDGFSDPDWRTKLPVSQGTFLGQVIDISIDCRSTKDTTPNEEDFSLIELVLSHLATILPATEAALDDYNTGAVFDYKELAINPTIWIPEERDTPTEWSFVVERKDWPDFGWHIEFDGGKFLDIWSGS